MSLGEQGASPSARMLGYHAHLLTLERARPMDMHRAPAGQL